MGREPLSGPGAWAVTGQSISNRPRRKSSAQGWRSQCRRAWVQWKAWSTRS